MRKSLEILNRAAAQGMESVTSAWVAEQARVSPQGAANLLKQLRREGLVEQVGHGLYAIRKLGVAGSKASSEDLALAVGARFAGRPHRLAYRSALEYWDVLSHPWSEIQVSTPMRVRQRTLSGRPLRVIHEPASSVDLGTTSDRNGAVVSLFERALLDCAARPELIGGADVIAEALVSGRDVDVVLLHELSDKVGNHAAYRRIGSIAGGIGDTRTSDALAQFAGKVDNDIDLEPRLAKVGPWKYRDRRWRVRWPITPDELVASVRQ